MGGILPLAACLLLGGVPSGMAQETELDIPAAELAEPSRAGENQNSDIYFADVLVRGRTLFQVGGLAEIDAQARAAAINRRIASLLASSEQPEAIEGNGP